MDRPRSLAIDLRPARSPEELAHAATLFREYANGLGFALDFQGFEEELAHLPGEYEEPRGVILLAWPQLDAVDAAAAGAEPIACVALRPLEDEGVCEMKRMYVRPVFRGLGLARTLATALIDLARARGYQAMRLDTVPAQMRAAERLYRDLGFVDIPAYYDSPLDAVYLERDLRS